MLKPKTTGLTGLTGCGFMNKRKTITRIKNIEKIYSKVIKLLERLCYCDEE